MPPLPVHPSPDTRSDAATLAAGLCHLPGLVWFDDQTGQGGWKGEWIAADPAEIRSGHWPDAPPPVPAAGEFWAGTIDYDGTWRFARYPRWLHRATGSPSWQDPTALLGHWQAPPPAADWTPPASSTISPAKSAFLSMVGRAKEYIAAGDIYQVNLARSFTATWPAPVDPFAFFVRLRAVSPAPLAALLSQGDRSVLSASPETFLRRDGMRLLTRPIKGTRPRGGDASEDARFAEELAASPKERAELVMITDLERNDLGRIARTGSVQVVELCALESFAQVHHQVSTVSATLRPGLGWPEIWDAMFPGGSITGAPKVRAMEIIRELEPAPRGLYTGAIGWMLGPDQGVFSIAIRTAVASGRMVGFHTGSGIVEGSSPEAEYQETIHKAAGLALACGFPGGRFPDSPTSG